jgi:CBS domain-containing protein
MDTTLGVGKLEVRSRHVEAATHGPSTQFTVYCPFRKRSVDLEVCEECAAFAGEVENAQGTADRIGCRRLGPTLDLSDVAAALAVEALERTSASRLMTRHVVCVQPEVTLGDVAAILVRHHLGSVPVVDDDFRLLGVVSTSDLLGKPESSRAAFAMAPAVVAVNERASLIDAARAMADAGIHRVPVTSEDGRVVGILSSIDVMRFLSRELPQGEGVAGIDPD